MVAYTPNLQIAAGNNNAAGLAAVNTLTDANGVKLVMPRAIPYHEYGQLVIGANGAPAYEGFPTQDWEFSVLLMAQYYLLRNTYTGLVTVKTDITGSSANYNATAWIDEKTQGQYAYLQGSVYDAGFTGPGLRRVRLHLLRLEAL